MPTVTLKNGNKHKFPYSATGKVKAHVFHKNNAGSSLKNNPNRLNYYPKEENVVKDKNTGKMVRRKNLSPNQPAD